MIAMISSKFLSRASSATLSKLNARNRLYPRCFSSFANFTPVPPTELTSDMASGIVESTQFYCKFGISNQKFRALAEEDLPIVERWQKMMEAYLQTQAHVISGMGYPPNEEGLTLYVQHLQACIQATEPTMREIFVEIRRETWREVVATVFKMQPEDIPVLTLEEAQALMHKVSTKMTDPKVLLEIHNRTVKITDEKSEIQLAKKHQVLQDVLVSTVYLGGSPSLVEETGFGTGPVAYAKMQCALTDHEGDALMADYASKAMVTILQTAGVDLNQKIA